MSIAGLVLAGGRATRFGGDKALALLNGAPLIAYAYGALSLACDELAINARPGGAVEAWADEVGFSVVHDTQNESAGPLWGIQAGLLWARDLGAATLAVCPCDTPLVPRDFVDQLTDAGPAAVAADDTGAIHALCSLWPVELLSVVEDELRKPRHTPIHRLQAELGFIVVPMGGADLFANVNSPDDLQRLANS